jgi:glycosyltransferase involved in cell wall biosynthesis
LFPWSIGGIERWYRALAEGLVEAGASVTYVTRLQWDEPPDLDGIDVVAVRGPRDIYHPDGRRRADQPVRYAGGVLTWLLRNRNSFDALQLANFPYFTLLAARAALAGTKRPMLVDWFEVWPPPYWAEYGGPIIGRFGYLIQELCIRLTPRALVFWDHTADRLRAHGLRTQPIVLPGLLRDAQEPIRAHWERSAGPPTVFFSGRHIRDKGVTLLPEALRIARTQIPDLRMVIAGEGVQTALVKSMVAALELTDCVDFVGKLTDAELFQRIADSTCVAVPSIREGYGLAAVEANAHGTPAIVTDGPENAAVGHMVDGRNGYVVSPTSAAVAEGIIKAVHAGNELRRTTVAEYARMTAENGMRHSIQQVVTIYAELLGRDTSGTATRPRRSPHEAARVGD